MRRHYASDKKKREDAKRKQKEEKRLKRLSRTSATNSPEATMEPVSNKAVVEAEVHTDDPKR